MVIIVSIHDGVIAMYIVTVCKSIRLPIFRYQASPIENHLRGPARDYARRWRWLVVTLYFLG